MYCTTATALVVSSCSHTLALMSTRHFLLPPFLMWYKPLFYLYCDYTTYSLKCQPLEIIFIVILTTVIIQYNINFVNVI